jgi:hypothetical protein
MLYLRHDIKAFLEKLLQKSYPKESSEITDQGLYEVGCDLDIIENDERENSSSLIVDFHFHE